MKPWLYSTLFFTLILIQPAYSEELYVSEPHSHDLGICSTPFNCGFVPQDFVNKYGVNKDIHHGEGQTIAIIDAYYDPAVLNNVQVFSQVFSTPSHPIPTFNSGGAHHPFFWVVNAQNTYVPYHRGWAIEENLDVQYAHAIAPRANIMLVVARSNSNSDLYQAVDVAVQQGATTISMSFGAYENYANTRFRGSFDNHPKVTFVASSGDQGSPWGRVEFPASHADVVAVGGTQIFPGQPEEAWSGSGGGYSSFFLEPNFQDQIQATGRRSLPDVAMDANPFTGATVFVNNQWMRIGGASLAAPMFAGVIALAKQLNRSGQISKVLPKIYAMSRAQRKANFNDIVWGTNGTYYAGPGYDLVTGFGSPNVLSFIQYLSR